MQHIDSLQKKQYVLNYDKISLTSVPFAEFATHKTPLVTRLIPNSNLFFAFDVPDAGYNFRSISVRKGNEEMIVRFSRIQSTNRAYTTTSQNKIVETRYIDKKHYSYLIDSIPFRKGEFMLDMLYILGGGKESFFDNPKLYEKSGISYAISFKNHEDQITRKDSLFSSLLIKNVLIDGKLYNAADTANLEIKTEFLNPLKVSINKDSLLKINFKQVGFFHLNDLNTKNSFTFNQSLNLVVHSKKQQMKISFFDYFSKSYSENKPFKIRNGITYTIDTLVFTCGDFCLDEVSIHKQLKDSVCIKPFHFKRTFAYSVQSPTKIDSLLADYYTIAAHNKKINMLNKNAQIEYKTQTYACGDTITTHIHYKIGKHKNKEYRFDEKGNISNIYIIKNQLVFFRKICKGYGGFDGPWRIHCKRVFVSRKPKWITIPIRAK